MKLIDILCNKIGLPRSELVRQVKIGLCQVDGLFVVDKNKTCHPGQDVRLGKTMRFVISMSDAKGDA